MFRQSTQDGLQGELEKITALIQEKNRQQKYDRHWKYPTAQAKNPCNQHASEAATPECSQRKSIRGLPCDNLHHGEQLPCNSTAQH